MKTSLSLGFIVAVASSLAACSSDEGTPRNNAGTGPVAGNGGQVGVAGTSGGGAGGTGSGGTSSGGTGGSGSSAFTAGPALVITPTAAGDANIVDVDGESGISGGVILAQSTMQVPAVRAHRAGALCMSGTTATVLNDDYTTYWGAELSMDLLLGPPEGAAPVVADAGADAGTVPFERKPFPLGDIVGFSYVVTGNGVAGAGIPASNEFRFKALPVGSDPALDTYCSEPTVTSGAVTNVPLSAVTWQCWQTGNVSLAEDPINIIATAGATLTQRPNPRQLQTISWQVASTITAPIEFDLCISDIKPLYAQ
jgi:hypothetical protein